MGFLAWLLLASPLPSWAAAPGDSGPGQALSRIRQWVHGRYDNARQAQADLANPAVPDDQKHRLMHQLFVPVTLPVPAIPGYLVFQQASVDGSDDPRMIIRVGLLQFVADEEAGVVRQRELNFKDPGAFKNAYRDQARLSALTLDAFNADPGCDFLLRVNAAGNEVAGPMLPGACRFFSRGLNKELVADDAVTIRADEYWFLGRFVDENGNVMWGNASPEPVKMQRLPDPGP